MGLLLYCLGPWTHSLQVGACGPKGLSLADKRHFGIIMRVSIIQTISRGDGNKVCTAGTETSILALGPFGPGPILALGPFGPWANFSLFGPGPVWAQGHSYPIWAGARLGPGPILAYLGQGPFGPRAHLGPWPIGPRGSFFFRSRFW